MNNLSCLQHYCFANNTEECLRTYEQIYELYDIHLYKVCSWCGLEYDYYPRCTCPCCGDFSDDPPAGGFVFFPELEVETSLSRLFPELFFYP